MLDSNYYPRNDREWRATTGLEYQLFMKLVPSFEQAYINIKGKSLSEVIKDNPQGHLIRFKSYENLLFFGLFALKTGLTYDVLGFIFKLDLANAKRNFNTIIDIFYDCLDNLNCLPIRLFNTPIDFNKYFKNQDTTLIFDGTEQLIQRPSEKQNQKLYYSGKKKGHSIKCLIISTLDKYIHYTSYSYTGASHDFSIVKQEFPPEQNWFDGYTILLDLGYQGFWTQYPNAYAFLPYKKRKNQELTKEQKNKNRALAQDRIKIEHSIGGMKRFDFLSGKCRIHDFHLYDKILGVCAGLWNYMITN